MGRDSQSVRCTLYSDLLVSADTILCLTAGFLARAGFDFGVDGDLDFVEDFDVDFGFDFDLGVTAAPSLSLLLPELASLALSLSLLSSSSSSSSSLSSSASLAPSSLASSSLDSALLLDFTCFELDFCGVFLPPNLASSSSSIDSTSLSLPSLTSFLASSLAPLLIFLVAAFEAILTFLTLPSGTSFSLASPSESSSSLMTFFLIDDGAGTLFGFATAFFSALLEPGFLSCCSEFSDFLVSSFFVPLFGGFLESPLDFEAFTVLLSLSDADLSLSTSSSSSFSDSLLPFRFSFGCFDSDFRGGFFEVDVATISKIAVSLTAPFVFFSIAFGTVQSQKCSL